VAPAIRAVGLSKAYGTVKAVRQLDFEVPPGEVFGFLGPNGAGKTTTVKMLLGLVKPTSGRAEIFGTSPDIPAARAQVGFLPEHFRFPEWLPAAEFLEFHARLCGLDRRDRVARAAEILARVGLAGKEHIRLGHFSKGMLQRIGLAQALLHRPRIVFLDEPTSGLDPVGTLWVRDIIRELRADGVTVFLNSHLLKEVEAVCDRVGIVRGGRMVHLGTVSALTASTAELEIDVGVVDQTQLTRLGPPLDAATISDGRLVVRFMPPVGREGIAEVVRALVLGGVDVYGVRSRGAGLEDLFMRLMNDDEPR
jgi:ABC-2 type transport system ATP-binding protein